jgi:hypothetical protein
MSGRSAMGWVIKFYVADPINHKVVDQSIGIASTGFGGLFFVAQHDGVYTMHFDNSVGDPFNKTVSLSYRITQSVFGIPVEHLLLCMLITTVVLILVVVVIMWMERSKATLHTLKSKP